MRFQLNHKKPDNYAFYDPGSRLLLTLSHPVDSADRVTSGIQRGLTSGVIIALDEPAKENKPVVPIVPIEKVEEVKAPAATEEINIPEKEEQKTEVKEEPVVEKEKPKRGRKKTEE